MSKFGKVAFAGLKVFKKDLENYLSESLDELGINRKCNNDFDSLDEELESKREEVIKKVNKFFDNIKDELKEGKGDSSKQNDKADTKTMEDIALTMKELRHQLNQLQQDVTELKSKS